MPSLMAVVERAEREVVVEVGVPLNGGDVTLASVCETGSRKKSIWLTGLQRACLGPRAQAEGR